MTPLYLKERIVPSQLLLPLLNPDHIKEINISSIHVTELTSSPESLCLIVCRSRAVATSWIMTCGPHIRDRDHNGGSSMADSVSWLADRDNKGGSFIVLASDNGGGPRSRWQLMVDPNGGSEQWLWTIVASDLDRGSWSCWLLTIDYDCSRTAWYIVFLLRYLTITDNNPSIYWPSVMLQNVYS